MESAVLRSMLLLSTLSTAAEVWYGARERRDGRDPSGQETSKAAAAWVRAERKELQEMLMRLRAGLVYARHHEAEAAEHLVRHFDALMTLARAARLLHRIHQRLLSLYPAVSEDLVEEVRILEGTCSHLVEADEEAFEDALGSFIEQALVCSVHLQQEVG